MSKTVLSGVSNIPKFAIFFLGTGILLFFILRTIFRFSVLGYQGGATLTITERDIQNLLVFNEKLKEKTLAALIMIAVAKKVVKKRLYGVFCANLFLEMGSLEEKDEKDVKEKLIDTNVNAGLLIIVLFSILGTLLLGLFLF